MGTTDTEPCPCGGGKPYAACCAPLHHGQPAPSVEALMRSRYSAYAMGLVGYLRNTWHASTRPADLNLADGPKWVGLTVLSSTVLESGQATVEFVARYKVGGRAGKLHETSRFVCEHGYWFYVDGVVA